MVSDAGFQDFFSAPYAGVEMSAAGLRLRCFLPLFARVMDMCSVFCGGCISVISVYFQIWTENIISLFLQETNVLNLSSDLQR